MVFSSLDIILIVKGRLRISWLTFLPFLVRRRKMNFRFIVGL